MQQFEVPGEVAANKSKVNRICDALRSELERVHNESKDNFYMLPILTTYIKKDP